MSPDMKQMELDRVVNLVKSFGFDITSSSIQDDRVVVVSEKTMVTTSADQKRFEGDRITQVLKSMDWVQKGVLIAGDKITLNFEKVVKPVA